MPRLALFSLFTELISVSPRITGTAEPGGLGGFSPPTFEEDDIFFFFSIWYV